MLCFQKGNGKKETEKRIRYTQGGQTDSVWAFFCPTSYGANILPGSIDSSKVFETSFIHCQHNMMSIVLWGGGLGDGDKFSTFATSSIFFQSACSVEQSRKSL